MTLILPFTLDHLPFKDVRNPRENRPKFTPKNIPTFTNFCQKTPNFCQVLPKNLNFQKLRIVSGKIAQNSRNLGTFEVVLGKSEVLFRQNYSKIHETWQKLDKIGVKMVKTWRNVVLWGQTWGKVGVNASKNAEIQAVC